MLILPLRKTTIFVYLRKWVKHSSVMEFSHIACIHDDTPTLIGHTYYGIRGVTVISNKLDTELESFLQIRFTIRKQSKQLL